MTHSVETNPNLSKFLTTQNPKLVAKSPLAQQIRNQSRPQTPPLPEKQERKRTPVFMRVQEDIAHRNQKVEFLR